MSGEFSGKVVLITGAGSGLGLSMAKAFAECDAKVVITDLNQERIDAACNEIGSGACGYVHDVTDFEATPKLIAAIEKENGPINCLINNAGMHMKRDPVDVEDAALAKIIDTNLIGVFALSRETFKFMEKRGTGSIIMISSMSALLGLQKVVGYSITKSGLLGATMSLATDWGPKGIRVNAICPGFIDTPMFRQATDSDPARQQKILGRTPLAKFGAPEDIADAAVFLASEKAKFITGATLPVDGGFSIGF
mgnify:CR=1 FL=1